MKPTKNSDEALTTAIAELHHNIAIGALAANTRRTYAKAWADFTAWCRRRRIQPLDANPDQVAEFLIKASTTPTRRTGRPLSVGSIAILNCAIAKHFWLSERQSPTSHPKVVTTMRSLERINGRPPMQVKALREQQIIKMINQCDAGTLIGVRDAALLAVGFAAALRRCELCALQVADIEVLDDEHGLRMTLCIRRSKTDQAGLGQTIPVPDGQCIKPVTRLRRWMRKAAISDGHLFRSLRRGGTLRGDCLHHSDIPRLVKKYAAAIGLDPTHYAGHSLRAGFVTSAAAHGARMDKIMDVTRHTNTQTVLKYIRDANKFTDHAGASFL